MFITFEGIEGSSKTTQSKLLSNWLTTKNISHISTKEPGTIFSKECQQIRHLLLSPENNLSPRAELLLYLADRAQHVESCVKPALKENKWVICDRYSWSTYAYQGYGRGLVDELGDFFKEMLHYSAGSLWPDLTFIMDIPVELGLQRAKRSNVEFAGGDRMENEEIEFHEKIRNGFISIAKKHPDKCILIDANKSIDDLHNEIIGIISSKI